MPSTLRSCSAWRHTQFSSADGTARFTTETQGHRDFPECAEAFSFAQELNSDRRALRSGQKHRETHGAATLRTEFSVPLCSVVQIQPAASTARRHRMIAATIVVEPAAGLLTEPAGFHILHEQRTRAILRVRQRPLASKHLHYGETGIEANEIGELQRAHRVIGAEPHRGVDRFDVSDTFVQRVDRLVDHRQQDAIDDERREILGIGRRSSPCALHGRRARGTGRSCRPARDAMDPFDQLPSSVPGS